MSRNFTLLILLGMILGIGAGALCNVTIHDPVQLKDAAGYFSLITDVFLRLIKMIIAPLVLATLVSGIAHMGDGAAIGRVGAKTLGWFLMASLVSLTLGVGMVTLLHPGSGLHLALPSGSTTTGVQTTLSLKGLRSPRCPQLLGRRHGQERNLADRGLLPVRRGGHRGAGEPGGGDAGPDRATSPGHAEDDQLRDAARPSGGVRGSGLPPWRRRGSASWPPMRPS